MNSITRIARSAHTAWLAYQERAIPFRSEDELQALQSRRFRALLQHAWRNVPYYRAWMRDAGAQPGDLRSAADLGRMPLIDKMALTLQPEQFAAAGYDRRDGLTLLSSGTSGVRRSFRYDTAALFAALAAGRRQRIPAARFIGRENGFSEAIFSRPGSAGTQLRKFWEDRSIVPKRMELKRRRFDPALSFEEILTGVNEFKPDLFGGIGSYLGAFLRWVAETGRYLEKPKAVSYGADAMPKADREVIEKQLGIPVTSNYQAIEALRIAFQCELRQGFHISTDQVAVRVVNPQGVDVAPGERGELILTNLTNRATVVMNYRLGDLVTLAQGRCACGRNFPMIQDIDGRLDDLLMRPDGSRVHAFSIVPQLQAVAGLRQVQVIQESLENFRLRVVWIRESEAQPDELARRMKQVFGDRIRITIDSEERLEQEPSGKFKSVVRAPEAG